MSGEAGDGGLDGVLSDQGGAEMERRQAMNESKQQKSTETGLFADGGEEEDWTRVMMSAVMSDCVGKRK